MGRAEMGIPENHPLGLVPHERLKRPIIGPLHR